MQHMLPHKITVIYTCTYLGTPTFMVSHCTCTAIWPKIQTKKRLGCRKSACNKARLQHHKVHIHLQQTSNCWAGWQMHQLMQMLLLAVLLYCFHPWACLNRKAFMVHRPYQQTRPAPAGTVSVDLQNLQFCFTHHSMVHQDTSLL